MYGTSLHPLSLVCKNAKVYKIVWMERETNKSPKVIDTCACYIKIKYQIFYWQLTIFLERSQSVLLYIKEGGTIEGYIVSTDCKMSPIPSRGSETSLLMTLKKRILEWEIILRIMKNCMSSF